ncbi:MAG: hypothetical protein AAB954_00465 [Patescibacteria group bacterium]
MESIEKNIRPSASRLKENLIITLNNFLFRLKANNLGLRLGLYYDRDDMVGNKAWGEPVFTLETPDKRPFQYGVFLNPGTRLNEDANSVAPKNATKMHIHPLPASWRLPRFNTQSARHARLELFKATT